MFEHLRPLLHAADADHLRYLAVAVCTHAVVGYTAVAAFTDASPGVGAVTGVAADVDLLFPHGWLFPFIHRGLTHTPAFLLFVVAVCYAARAGTERVTAVVCGFGTHLVLDTATRTGVMWLYPAATARYALPMSGHSAEATLALWVGCGSLLLRSRRFDEEPPDD